MIDVPGDIDLGGEGRLRPIEQRGQHLPRLVRVVVDRLLAEDDEPRLLLIHQCLQQLGHGKRLQFNVRFDQDCAVGANGQCRAKRFLTGREAARDGDYFGGDSLFS